VTIIQLEAPDDLRGRLVGLQMAVVNGGPRLGDVEAGAVATAVSSGFAVVSGGVASVAGAIVLAAALPASAGTVPAELAPRSVAVAPPRGPRRRLRPRRPG
jgi:hypothetical protein